MQQQQSKSFEDLRNAVETQEQTDEAISINEQLNQQQVVEEKKTLKERIKSFTHSQRFAHILMGINLLLFGGFAVLNPISLESIHPVLSCCFRALVMAVTMFPFAAIFDYKFEFRSINSNIDLHWIFVHMLKKIPQKDDAMLLVLCGTLQIASMVLNTFGTMFTSPTIGMFILYMFLRVIILLFTHISWNITTECHSIYMYHVNCVTEREQIYLEGSWSGSCCHWNSVDVCD
jgi:hypothetical protein